MGNRIRSTWRSYQAMAVVDRTALAAAGSVASGISMAVVKIGLGIMTHSLLFIVNAVYYIALCLSRLAIVQQHRSIRTISDSLKRLEREMSVYHRTGLLLCFIGLSYAVFSGFMFFVKAPTRYTQIVAITVATITAVKIGVAIRGLVVAKRERNPMDSAIKFITFTDALLSLVVCAERYVGISRVGQCEREFRHARHGARYRSNRCWAHHVSSPEHRGRFQTESNRREQSAHARTIGEH